MKEIRLYESSNNNLILNKLKLADTFSSRFFGLMGKTLDESEGLLIQPCNSIHCFFMKIPIDVLFLDHEMRVLHKILGLKPWKISPIIKGAKSVIEGPKGSFAKIQVGDILKLG